MKFLTCQEKAYIAGFLDGDGCLNAQIVQRHDYILKYQIHVSVTFYQKTQRHWFLIKLNKKLHYGSLRKRPDGISEYSITGSKSVYNLVTALLPYLQLKKRQAKLLLEIIQAMPHVKHDAQAFLTLCEKVDRFSVLNDSKKRLISSQTVRDTLGIQ